MIGSIPEFCDARCPGLGQYAGYRCCSPKGHDGHHTITCGWHEPPYNRVVFTWSAAPTKGDGT